mmetsp:Transcript_2682/g.7476  ORF Transcript_2682/g.7476 Transcript_2682/m.7476 type:complete len:170 (-) Transcript_2682:21-530(-)
MSERIWNFLSKRFNQIMAVPILITFNDCVASVRVVEGSSFPIDENTSDDKQLNCVILNKLSARMSRYERGDLCLMRSPEDHHQTVFKRVVALEGDRVRTAGQGVVLVPQGYCWVEGAGSDGGRDSNSYGAVPLGLIQARALFVAWPPPRAGPVRRWFPHERVLTAPTWR